MVESLPATQETRVQSLGREDPLQKGDLLAWRILMDRGAWWAIVHEVTKESDMTKWLSMHPRMWVGQHSKEDGQKSANLHVMER